MALIAESPKNFEAKTICCFVLDTSSSMGGEPIKELNKGLKEFQHDIQEDETTAQRLEVAIIAFNSDVNTVQKPALVADFTMPNLTVTGTTKMVDAVREAMALIETRKQWYKQTGQQYLRPWIILITDGEPDAGQDIHGLAQEISERVNNKTFVFFAVGVQGANMNVLQTISAKPFNPCLLQGLKFSEFFEWLSNSMETVSKSAEDSLVSLPSPTGWMEGFTVA
jgi:uncharacterized protein YegL